MITSGQILLSSRAVPAVRIDQPCIAPIIMWFCWEKIYRDGAFRRVRRGCRNCRPIQSAPRGITKAAEEPAETEQLVISVVDSQNSSGDAFFALAMTATLTKRFNLRTSVTNPITHGPRPRSHKVRSVCDCGCHPDVDSACDLVRGGFSGLGPSA